jgi:hypothetical protein
MRLPVLIAMTLTACVAQADPADARRSADQRLRYVAELLRDEGALARISANEAARRETAAAREHLERGRRLLDEERGEAALREADQALQALLKARRLAPDPASEAAAARARYERQLAGVESLLASLRDRRDRTPESAADTERGARRVAEARQLADSGRFAQAELVLATAAALLASALDRLMAGRTLDYTPRFASTGEQYVAELARHRSLRELVPVALRALQPDAEAKRRVDQYLLASGRLMAAAERAAGNHDHQAALDALREATAYLQRALTATGVAYPI